KSKIQNPKPKIELAYLKLPFQPLRRVPPDPHFEYAVLYRISHLQAPEAELAYRQLEAHGLLFSRLQPYALEALELFHRPRDAAHQVAHVQLHDFIARLRTAVAYARADDQHAARGNDRCLDLQVAILETRVAEPETEREQRRV